MKNIIITILLVLLFVPISAQDDITPPELTYFSITPSAVDVTDSSAVVNVTLGAIDDLSGLSYGSASFHSPSYSHSSSAYFSFDSDLTDTVTYQMVIDQYVEPGEWSLSFISLTDEVDNNQFYDESELDSLGISGRIIVTSSEDSLPPEINYFSIDPDSVDVTDSSAVVNVMLGAIDDLSGLSYGSASFHSPSYGHSSSAYFSFDSDLTDTVTYQMVIDQYVEPGEWSLSFISLTDEVDNNQFYDESELDSLGVQSTFIVSYYSENEGQVWYVDMNGSDTTGNGSQDYPFATIQRGIDATSDGDTVLVAAGTYVEPEVDYGGYEGGPTLFEKSNLVIMSESNGTTTIDLDDHYYGFCFTDNSSNNIIKGFTIKNAGDYLITAMNSSSDNSFIDCVFLTTGGESFTYVTYYAGHEIINCTFIGDGANQAIYNHENAPSIINSIVYNYEEFVGSNYLNDVTIDYSLLYEVGGTLPTGDNLLFDDPLFCNLDSVDFTLAENSPCVGTGENGADMGAFGVGCEAMLSTHQDVIPLQFALYQNYPNPFNPTTMLRYGLSEDALVTISIYDVMGRSIKLLVNSNQMAGYRSVRWDATNNLGEPVSAGIYIYMIQAGEFRQTKKMVLLK